MTSRVVFGLKNQNNLKTARMNKVPAVWSEDEEALLKRPHGPFVFVLLLAA